jgi:hypothetical protein
LTPTTELQRIVESCAQQQITGHWFLKPRHIVLPEDGTIVAKHDGGASLMSIHTEWCALDWCNKFSARNEEQV